MSHVALASQRATFECVIARISDIGLSPSEAAPVFVRVLVADVAISKDVD